VHRPESPRPEFAADLSYLGTYAEDRQDKLERLLLAAARERVDKRFLIGGSQYPPSFSWVKNLYYVQHVPPHDHAAFFSSAGLTLNITRKAMVAMGWCPSGRLFEAAACGAAIVTDAWDGLDAFFQPGVEVVVANDTADVLAALDLGDEQRRLIGEAARERTLSCHTAMQRARDLEGTIAGVVAAAHAPCPEPQSPAVTADTAPVPIAR
jgi:spore maturation protein CgeB